MSLSKAWQVPCAIFALLASHLAAAQQQQIDVSGSVSLETRTFLEEPLSADQLDVIQTSIAADFEFYLLDEETNVEILIEPFVRIDTRDTARTHLDLRQAYVRWSDEVWSVRAGLGKVFWGVTESRHLVDIINQDDFVEDIDGEDKLGQPFVEVMRAVGDGSVYAYILPGFRRQTAPGETGRLRTPLVSSDADEGGRFEFEGLDFSLRYEQAIGDFDIGLHVFHGTGREPILSPEGSITQASYTEITQVGADIQMTDDAWLWKLEAIAREGQGRPFFATVAGLEYTFFDIGESGVDFGLLAELQYDGREFSPSTVPLTVFDNDLFFGSRIALNDYSDSSILLGTSFDWETNAVFTVLEAKRRLGDELSLTIEGRFFLGAGDDPVLGILRNDSFVSIGLDYFF